jgi:hypothetical protein
MFIIKKLINKHKTRPFINPKIKPNTLLNEYKPTILTNLETKKLEIIATIKVNKKINI